MIEKIDISSLRIGMYVQGVSKTEEGYEDFKRFIPVRTTEQIERFIEDGVRYAYVFMDEAADSVSPFCMDESLPAEERFSESTYKSLASGEPVQVAEVVKDHASEDRPLEEYVHPTAESQAPDTFVAESPRVEAVPEPILKVEFKEEIDRAKSINEEAFAITKEFMNDVRAGKALDTSMTKEVVVSIVDSILRNKEALLSLAKLKDFDDYTFTHSVNVCIIAVALGECMNPTRAQLYDLALGAMLHDVGKMKVPEKILQKITSLSETEYLEVKKHVDYSTEILCSSTGMSDDTRCAILQHHEWYNGTGYPNKISGKDIHPYARIVSIADYYDALTTRRIYRDMLIPSNVMKRIFLLENEKFDPEMADRFIKCLGIYPSGSFVEINTGEVGVVKATNMSNLMTPIVAMLFDSKKQLYPKSFDIDLSADEERRIIGAVNPAHFMVNFDSIAL
ncbi:MAG: HD-GYP domain-containing protein [Proteobacteria bacterium]|nr:HD-GYP domain-containing protein [Pseudomonadota bacterium]